jgi:probable addiction module antidote protein
MSQVARDAGLSRAGLHKALSAEGDPRLSTLLKVLRALGLRVHIGAIKADA